MLFTYFQGNPEGYSWAARMDGATSAASWLCVDADGDTGACLHHAAQLNPGDGNEASDPELSTLEAAR